MKNLIVILIFFLSLNAFAFTGQWVYGPSKSNPTTSTVMVTTTFPASGSTASPPSANYVVGLLLYCSVNATYQLNVLNQSSVIVATVPFSCSSTQINQWQSGRNAFPIQDGYTLQILPAAGFTGFGSANLFYSIEGINLL